MANFNDWCTYSRFKDTDIFDDKTVTGWDHIKAGIRRGYMLELQDIINNDVNSLHYGYRDSDDFARKCYELHSLDKILNLTAQNIGRAGVFGYEDIEPIFPDDCAAGRAYNYRKAEILASLPEEWR